MYTSIWIWWSSVAEVTVIVSRGAARVFWLRPDCTDLTGRTPDGLYKPWNSTILTFPSCQRGKRIYSHADITALDFAQPLCHCWCSDPRSLMRDFASWLSLKLQVRSMRAISCEFTIMHPETCADEVKPSQHPWLLTHAQTPPGRCKRPFFFFPWAQHSVYDAALRQSAAKQPKNSVRCITLLMLLRRPQCFSAGGEVKQDHLLLFLERNCLRGLTQTLASDPSFVVFCKCETHVKQDAANTSHDGVFLIRSLVRMRPK